MAGKSNGIETDWARAPPPSLPFGQRLSRIFYNPDDHSFFGRTPKRWGIVLTFYLIFYAVLAAMFAVCMVGLFSTIDETKPTHILEHSLIGANPGVSYQPKSEDFVEGKLRYSVENKSASEEYINKLIKFLEPYTKTELYSKGKGCKADDKFGFPKSPCFFVKVNKIYGWKPDYYTAADLPEDMPEDLVSYIKDPENAGMPNQVWISCWEEKDGNTTLIEYPWGRGLSSEFYPYKNTKGYLSPVLPVKITPLVNKPVVIRCRAWAKNILYNKSIKEPRGYTRIQLHVEEDTTVETTTIITTTAKVD